MKSYVPVHGKQRVLCSANFSMTLQTGILSTETSGPGSSKLTMSLVNISLKFQSVISNIHQFFVEKSVRSFCSAKASLIFSTKISVYLIIKS